MSPSFSLPPQQIQNADASDFLTTSVVATFLEGETNAVANVFVINDNIPEGNETFTVVISDALSGAEVGLRSSMELVISANDEPFGSVQFDAVSDTINMCVCVYHLCCLFVLCVYHLCCLFVLCVYHLCCLFVLCVPGVCLFGDQYMSNIHFLPSHSTNPSRALL